MKKVKGLTLIETIVSIALLSMIILGTATFFFQRAENMRAKQLGNDMALIMNAIDKKMQMDAYSTKSWTSENWNNTNEFLEKLIGEELRTQNSSCGKLGGWVAETAVDPLTLIPCERLSGDKLPFNIQVKANFTKESTTNGDYNISLFNIDYYFNNKESYNKNFGSLLKAQKALDKFESAKNFTVHSYNWINIDTKQAISYENCLNIEEKCGLRTQLEVYAGISTDKVRIDGKNDLMGEIDFNNSNNKCTKWIYQSGAWISTPIKCTVKGGFDSDIGSVEAFINNTTITERISLKSKCTIDNYKNTNQPEDGKTVNWIDETNKTDVPCGFNKDGSIITTGVSDINAEIAISKDTIVKTSIVDDIKTKENTNVYGDATLTNIDVVKSVESTKSDISNKTDTNIIEVKNSVVSNLANSLTALFASTNALSVADANFNITTIFNAYLGQTIVGTFNMSGLMQAGTTTIDTRPAAFVNDPSDPTTYSRAVSVIINSLTTPIKFYSGYTPEAGDNGIANQYWNTLKINILNATGATSDPKIIGSTKTRSVLRTEMAKPTATDLQVDLYKDEKTFYSNPASRLKAGKLGSDGVLFTNDTPATTSMTSGYSIDAKAIFSKNSTTLDNNGSPIVKVMRNGVDKVVVQNGYMTINGDNLGGGHTTADFMVGWPGSTEGNISENGFRNKVFRNSLVSIVNGPTRFYGNLTQWKPLHMNSKYQGYDVCDRPNGVATHCLITGWNNLNSTQTILQRVQAEYEKLQSKLPPQKGNDGDKGEQGFKGSKGLSGLKGDTGLRGPAGPMQYLKVN